MAIRWGIIGLGDIAEHNFVPALAHASNATLHSVYSRRADKGKAFITRHGGQRNFDSLGQMLADPELDAVYIASPNAIHAEQSIAASRAGKHVLCDKPMALTEADGERMIRVAAENKVRLDVAYRQRYHPAHIAAREHVQSGVLGEMQLVKAQNFIGGARPYWANQPGWRNDPAIAGSGSIVAQAVHPVDLLRYLTGSEIVEVRCITDEAPTRAVEEATISLFKFANGALGQVASGAVVPRSDNDVVLYGSTGKISCLGTLGRNVPSRPPELLVESDNCATLRDPFHHDTLVTRTTTLIEAFSRTITDGTPTHISAENGLRMIRIANAMQESSRSGKTIRV